MSEDLEIMLARRTSAAVTTGDWPLVKALANVLIELETHKIVTESAHEAWKSAHRDRVVNVPLVAVPMRDETPQRALCAAPRGEMVCRREPGHEGNHEAVMRGGSPYWWANAASPTR